MCTTLQKKRGPRVDRLLSPIRDQPQKRNGVVPKMRRDQPDIPESPFLLYYAAAITDKRSPLSVYDPYQGKSCSKLARMVLAPDSAYYTRIPLTRQAASYTLARMYHRKSASSLVDQAPNDRKYAGANWLLDHLWDVDLASRHPLERCQERQCHHRQSPGCQCHQKAHWYLGRSQGRPPHH